MKKTKKLLAIFLALVMALSMIPFVAASAQVETGDVLDRFADEAQIEDREAAAVLAYLDIFRGTPQGGGVVFDPDGTFTRAQAAAIIARFNLGASVAAMLPAAPTGFADLDGNVNYNWAMSYVAYVYIRQSLRP